jgi:hypothetical protein
MDDLNILIKIAGASLRKIKCEKLLDELEFVYGEHGEYGGMNTFYEERNKILKQILKEDNLINESFESLPEDLRELVTKKLDV